MDHRPRMGFEVEGTHLARRPSEEQITVFITVNVLGVFNLESGPDPIKTCWRFLKGGGQACLKVVKRAGKKGMNKGSWSLTSGSLLWILAVKAVFQGWGEGLQLTR